MAGVRGAAHGSNGLENAAACYNECRARGVQGGHVDMLICAVAASTRPPGVYDRRGLSALREGPWSASSRAEITRLERIRALDEECPNPEAVEIPSVRMLRVLYPLLFARLIPSARSAPHTACPASSRRHVRGRDATLAGNGRAARRGWPGALLGAREVAHVAASCGGRWKRDAGETRSPARPDDRLDRLDQRTVRPWIHEAFSGCACCSCDDSRAAGMARLSQ